MNNNSTLNNNFSIKGTSSNTFSMFKGGYIILVYGSQKLDNIMGSGMTVLFSSTIFVHLFVTSKAPRVLIYFLFSLTPDHPILARALSIRKANKTLIRSA